MFRPLKTLILSYIGLVIGKEHFFFLAGLQLAIFPHMATLKRSHFQELGGHTVPCAKGMGPGL